MENPPQKAYSVDELFALQPYIQEQVRAAAQSVVEPTFNSPSDVAFPLSPKVGFWTRNKWYIIVGGSLCIVGTVLYLHAESKKRKS